EHRRAGGFPSASYVLQAAATGADGRLAAFSNRGSRAHGVLAPGVGLIGPFPGGTWARASGTSFAAPLVSGAVARLLETQPEIRDLAAVRNRIVRGRRLD